MAIAYFSTWTTYGTWLPGDERGWFQRCDGIQPPDRLRELESSLHMTEDAVTLDPVQRRLVKKTIRDHCAIRNWTLHAVNCRTNHVHVADTAMDRGIEIPREQFKSWCTRKLKEDERANPRPNSLERKNWWTQRGWDLFIDDEEHLAAVIEYILHGQDR
jgi:REP element-mobilizing transposase RayT